MCVRLSIYNIDIQSKGTQLLNKIVVALILNQVF